MIRSLGTIVVLCGLFCACGKAPEFKAPPKENQPAPAQPEPVAEEPVSEPVDSPEEPIAEPEEAGAVAPDEHQGFLSMEEITDNAEIRELVESMAISGGEKQKRADLKKLKSKGSYAALMRAMRSENANIRIQAARILRRSGVKSKAFTKALIGVVRTDPDKDVRGMIAEVLVYYDNRETVPALIDVLLHDGGDGARTNAARALAAIKDGRSVTPLINALDDKDTWVRLRAAGALKRMGAKRAVPALVERLNDPNKRVQERAHQALRALTGRSMGPDYATWRKAYPAR